MSDTKKLAMIAAVGPALELGSNGDLVWHISADLKNFKRLTLGHAVIMGRKTWESLPKRPLPGRLNVVVSHSAKAIDGAVCVASTEAALEACEDDDMPFVIGGAGIYKSFMPLADVLYLTQIDAEPDKEIDCYFPEYREDWTLREASDWESDPKGIRYRFEEWVRK
ncbi:MAG: dihydrofolate reductase [Muribaculaceae bacterium]|nr:dihydrofolate reductase [Muribaculaceae bacterium]